MCCRCNRERSHRQRDKRFAEEKKEIMINDKDDLRDPAYFARDPKTW